MVFLYNIVLIIILIPALFVLALRYRKRLYKEFICVWKQRLGIWDLSGEHFSSKPVLWIHCASIGEARAMEPMINNLEGYSIFITTLTYAGLEYIKKQKLSQFAYFLPVDFSFIINRLIKKIRPKSIILVETELWPGLLFAAKKNNVNVVIVNARMSEHSYKYYRFARFFWKKALSSVNWICARCEDDAKRFVKMGYPSQKITVTGNIKYDRDFIKDNLQRDEIGFSKSDFIIVCGSTREGEEEIIFDTWKILKQEHINIKLIIAPRHLNRVADIIKLMNKYKIEYILRSTSANSKFDCMLVDTFGELQKFYSIADVAVVGGSLVNKGGQNPIEPAAYSIPVLCGPNMYNFLNEMDIIINGVGGFIVNGKNELITKLKDFIFDEKFKIETGGKAYKSVESQRGALNKTLDIIKRQL